MGSFTFGQAGQEGGSAHYVAVSGYEARFGLCSWFQGRWWRDFQAPACMAHEIGWEGMKGLGSRQAFWRYVWLGRQRQATKWQDQSYFYRQVVLFVAFLGLRWSRSMAWKQQPGRRQIEHRALAAQFAKNTVIIRMDPRFSERCWKYVSKDEKPDTTHCSSQRNLVTMICLTDITRKEFMQSNIIK